MLVLRSSGAEPGRDIHSSRQDHDGIGTLAQLLGKNVSKAASTSKSYSHCISGGRTSSHGLRSADAAVLRREIKTRCSGTLYAVSAGTGL